MPNGLDYSKEYGPHDYGDRRGTHDCKHGCKCWMGPARSGGPIGVDPFGECPMNPKDGKLLGGSNDHEVVVIRRIRRLEKENYDWEDRAKKAEGLVGKDALELAGEIETLKEKLEETNTILEETAETLKSAVWVAD